MAKFRIEKSLLREGFVRIAGVDEVGRGSLFGPVVAAAVSFSPDWLRKRPTARTERIDDSKLLSGARRAELANLVLRNASGVGIGIASNAEIDTWNILRASHLAMKRAVENLPRTPDFLLVDGFPLKDVQYEQMGIPQGDRKSVSIAAASIVAKVFRDELMDIYDAVYEGYGLSRHKGYGTAEHFRVLRQRGPCGLHRMSFKLS